MNLDNIKVGMCFPNYRALCKALKEKVKGGNAKKAQMKEWERYILFERFGNSFLVKALYDVPKKRVDKRYEFLQYIEPVLLNYLASYGGTWRKHVFRDWFDILGMIGNYVFDDENQEEFKNYCRINSFTFRKTLFDAEEKCKEIIMNAVRSMHRRGMIEFKKKYYLIANNGETVPSNSELDDILHVERDNALCDVKCRNMYAVYVNPKKTETFFKALEKRLSPWGYKKYYVLLEIRCNRELISRYIDIDVEPYKAELKDRVRCALIRKIYRNHELEYPKMCDEEWNLEEIEKSKNNFRLPDRYAWDAEMTVNEFISV